MSSRPSRSSETDSPVHIAAGRTRAWCVSDVYLDKYLDEHLFALLQPPTAHYCCYMHKCIQSPSHPLFPLHTIAVPSLAFRQSPGPNPIESSRWLRCATASGRCCVLHQPWPRLHCVCYYYPRSPSPAGAGGGRDMPRRGR